VRARLFQMMDTNHSDSIVKGGVLIDVPAPVDQPSTVKKILVDPV